MRRRTDAVSVHRHECQQRPRIHNFVKTTSKSSFGEVFRSDFPDLLYGLFNDIFEAMELESTLIYSEQEFQSLVQRQHWPTWAIILVVVCVFLTIFAFLLGNCITKRAPPLRFKSGATNNAPANVRVENRRMWGAGFSGGMWAAA
ncbi:hypothetical protein Angca_000568 [Angiostrongylus cantonensis]|nr:hypothetical protein Angca_000568 [Angiostrongylus cantonensis]